MNTVKFVVLLAILWETAPAESAWTNHSGSINSRHRHFATRTTVTEREEWRNSDGTIKVSILKLVEEGAVTLNVEDGKKKAFHLTIRKSDLPKEVVRGVFVVEIQPSAIVLEIDGTSMTNEPPAPTKDKP